MEKAGIIERTNSPWSSPLHMVPKPDGSWRPCGDYRQLNTKTVPDHYPMPHINDMTSRLHGCTVFTKLDLTKAYYQVPMAPEDKKKTCICTPFGSFVFNVMPFGLLNAGATFQRVIDQIMGDLPYCFCYMDNILVASRNEHKHLQHLRQVFQRLQDNGLVVNFAKCEFSRSEMTFLGHTVSAEGIRPLRKHIKALENFPAPTDKVSVQRFLGLFNFFRRFVPAAAKILAPLSDLLKLPAKNFKMTDTALKAFADAKKALCTAALLRHPVPGARLALTTDASDTHVGAVLQQWESGAWAPLGFFSQKLHDAQLNYATFD